MESLTRCMIICNCHPLFTHVTKHKIVLMWSSQFWYFYFRNPIKNAATSLWNLEFIISLKCQNIVINNKIIEQVTEFIYLESYLSQYNNQKYMDRNLLKYNWLNGTLKIYFGKQTRKEIQLRFHNIVSKPALLHGNECWTHRQTDKSRINSSQTRLLGSFSGVTLRDGMKSEKIRKQWKVEEYRRY